MLTTIERFRMDSKLRDLIRRLEPKWGTRPRCVLALQDGADEHWQVYNPYDTGMSVLPRYTVSLDGGIEKVSGWED